MSTRKTSIFYILMAFLALPYASSAQEQAPGGLNRSIDVQGEAEVRVTPDEAIIAMTVSTNDKNLLVGKQKVNDATTAVLAAFKGLGIPQEDIKTDYMEVTPVMLPCNSGDYYAGKCNPTEINYYSQKKGIIVRLKDLNKFEELINLALQKGVNNIENVQFLTSELRKFRDQARDMAIKAAKEKAEAVAGALGQKTGNPITISVDNNWSYGGFYNARYSRDMMNNISQNVASTGSNVGTNSGNFQDSTSLGQIKVNATVHVAFELQRLP